jgi:hypothetical protein
MTLAPLSRLARSMLALMVASVVTAIGCSNAGPAAESTSPGEQSGTYAEHLRPLLPEEIVGAVAAEGTATGTAYANPPLYRALSFTGVSGKRYRATVTRDGGGGHAVVWIAENDGTTLGEGTDSAEATIAVTGTYYVVFRDQALSAGSFTVKLEEIEIPSPPSDAGSPGDAAADAADAAADGNAFVVPPALDGVPITVDLACTATSVNVPMAGITPIPAPETRTYAETITFHFVSAPSTVTYVPGIALPGRPLERAMNPVTVPTSKLRLDSATGPDVPVSFPTSWLPAPPDYPDTHAKCPVLPTVGEFAADSTGCQYAVGAICGHERPSCYYLKYVPYSRFDVTETATSYTYEVRSSESLYISPNWSLKVTLAAGKVKVDYSAAEAHGTGGVTQTTVTCSGEK